MEVDVMNAFRFFLEVGAKGEGEEGFEIYETYPRVEP